MNTFLPSPLRALLPAAGQALELALNRVLALDPDTQGALSELEGRHIDLALEAPPIALRLSIKAGHLRVGPTDADSEADLSLRATAGAVLARLLPGSDHAGHNGRLRISGDAELAQRLGKLVDRFDPDFDAAFAGLFGEVLGVQIARVLREGLRYGRTRAEHFARDAADYLTEERRDVVSRVEQSIFFDEVDALRDAVDRLEARVLRLAGRAG